ncbi:hypothetical protein CISG_08288 [Coccidioides immitis RMSCC 3703]|uniref:Calcineurin-like phosphoesterase domain-containing protein n=1 Tax=Coccidioides immitis RMSCC 3703 TaxID=454286 RepID=A0A0J8R6W8_COCIT|nr:hypothetical protein CISG_08288 [Coccidioides immitis RMSCC 3703]
MAHNCSQRHALADSAPAPTAFTNILKEHFGYRHDDGDSGNGGNNFVEGVIPPAPFRLLVLADPQIEGDSSLPGPNDGFTNHLERHWTRVVSASTWSERGATLSKAAKDIVVVDIPRSLDAARKRLDLFGNDYYLAHIYRTLSWWTRPTHVTVLGDLIGSQWVSDTEFGLRTRRYWNRVFKGGVRVDDEITITGSDGYGAGDERIERLPDPRSGKETIWSSRIISIAGNHDVGYAGDISEKRIERFEREFGRHNWDMRFEYLLPAMNDSSAKNARPTPSLHLIVLDSLLLDTPALRQSLQDKTYTFLNDRTEAPSLSFSLIYPSIKKQASAPMLHILTFSPMTMSASRRRAASKRRLRSRPYQRQSESRGILQGIFGMSGDAQAAPRRQREKRVDLDWNPDPTGCDVVHFVNHTSGDTENSSSDVEAGWSWDAQRYTPELISDHLSPSTPSVREVTLRSMMGEFGGNAGLLSLWFDADPSVMEWKYDIITCQLGVQHIWWIVHIAAVITLGMLMAWLILCLADGASTPSGESDSPPKASRVPGSVTRPMLKQNGMVVNTEKGTATGANVG